MATAAYRDISAKDIIIALAVTFFVVWIFEKGFKTI